MVHREVMHGRRVQTRTRSTAIRDWSLMYFQGWFVAFFPLLMLQILHLSNKSMSRANQSLSGLQESECVEERSSLSLNYWTFSSRISIAAFDPPYLASVPPRYLLHQVSTSILTHIHWNTHSFYPVHYFDPLSLIWGQSCFDKWAFLSLNFSFSLPTVQTLLWTMCRSSILLKKLDTVNVHQEALNATESLLFVIVTTLI